MDAAGRPPGVASRFPIGIGRVFPPRGASRFPIGIVRPHHRAATRAAALRGAAAWTRASAERRSAWHTDSATR
jgi:hypothetical protein